MSKSTSETFRRRLREERERAEISQMELARRMTGLMPTRIDSTSITRIEKGTRSVRLEEAVASARALDVSLSELLDTRETDLETQVAAAKQRLKAAEDALETALTEVDLRRRTVKQLQVELDNLDQQWQEEYEAEVRRELAEDLEIERWPLRIDTDES